MSDFLKRLSRDPYAPIDAASVVNVDELGNGYDYRGELIAPKYTAPEQSWGEMALGGLTAPQRLAGAVYDSLTPYQFEQSTSTPMNRAGSGQPITGGDPNGGGWQVPPIAQEGWDALTAVGDAYSGKVAPEDINSRALGMAGFMMGGGGPALALERSLAQRGISSTADMIPTGVKDYGQAAYRSIRYPHETPVVGPMSDMDIWQRFGMSTREGKDLNNAPFWEEPDGTLNMLYPDGPDTYGAFSGPNRLANEPGVPGDVNAYKAKPVRPDIEVIDGGLYSNADSRPAILAGALGQEQKGITAYHGSPHDFDKFDLSKIGTGEGAQAYGHGLYFAENEGVAKGYRDRLSGDNIDARNYWQGDRQADLSPLISQAEEAAAPFLQHPDHRKAVVRNILDAMDGNEGMSAKSYLDEYALPRGWEQAYSAAAQTLGDLTWKKNPGKMYQVRINADPNDFLDWDKPLSQQSEKVRAGARQALLERGLPKQIADYLATSDRSARDAMSALARGVYDTRLNVPDGEMAAQASSKLREAGIPGIKYLDQMSRNAGDGSRNYVVFDDSLIEILKKYGWLAPGAMYGADAMTGAQDNQYADGGRVGLPGPYSVAKSMIGQREGRGNDLLNRFLNGDTAGMTSAEYAWCSRFVKQAAAKAGVDVAKATDMARSWLDVGQPVDKPSVGDVVVLSRGNPNSQYGHVGFYEGTNPDGSVRILSGNHNNAVASGSYPASRVLGYRRLDGQPEAYDPATGQQGLKPLAMMDGVGREVPALPAPTPEPSTQVAEQPKSSFDFTKLASLFAEPEQAHVPQINFTPIQAFQPQGSPIQASTPYRGTFAHGGQVRGLPDQSEPIHAGPLHSTVPGRTDHLPITVAAGSFVLPADIVSSLGEGNTNAGMEAVSKMFPLPPVRRADGGRVPIAAAGGEFVIAPETVAAVGNGDMETGHELLDQFVRRTRAQNIQRLRALPGPEK